MWEQTGRLLWIWLRITLALAAICTVVLAVYGWDSTPFKVAALVAVGLNLLTVRALSREWSFQARGCWWWA